MFESALPIIQILQSNGFQGFVAGGAVRDMLLGKEPKDIDIVTDATPDQIEALFTRTYAVGKAFGVIHVHQGDQTFEVATFRSDSGYSDGRRPDFVTFSTAKEDAIRRDFTINGMFYDPIAEKLYDFVEGEKDLKEGVIRFIGDPETRVQEDSLRLLRAVRLAHQIQGQYEPSTYAAVKKHAGLVTRVSWERIRDELNKLILLPTRAEGFEDMQDLGLLAHVLPEIEAMKGVAQPKMYHREGSVWAHAMRAIRTLSGERAEDLRLLWATLLHDVGKPKTFAIEERIRFDKHAEVSATMANEILNRLRFPKKDIEAICWAVEHHMSLFHLLEKDADELMKRRWFTHPYFPLLLEVHRADAAGTLPPDYHSYNELYKLYMETMEKIPTELPKIISGEEIQEVFKVEGKAIGDMLAQIKDQQLLGNVSTKEEALTFLRNIQ